MTRRETSYVHTWRWAIARSDLPAVQRAVAWAMSLDMDADGGSCFPGAARVKRHTGYGLATVKAAIAGLVSKGWLIVVQRGGSPRDGVRHATEYRAVIPNPSSTQPGQEMTRSPDDTDPSSSSRRPVQDVDPIKERDLGKTKSEGSSTSDGELLARRDRWVSDHPGEGVPVASQFRVGARFGPPVEVSA